MHWLMAFSIGDVSPPGGKRSTKAKPKSYKSYGQTTARV